MSGPAQRRIREKKSREISQGESGSINNGPGRARDLGEILEGLHYQASRETGRVGISSVTADSRSVTSGSLFVAIQGETVDGHDFIEAAVAGECAAVLVEKGRYKGLSGSSTVVVEVEDTRLALGPVAAAFFGHPAREMKLVGITGTNGKTTTAYLLEAVIAEEGGCPGIIGTVNYRYLGREMPAPFTTPEPVALHGLLRRMVDAGVSHVVMEVSSHSLSQARLKGIEYDVALFTNLTRDHLDFHGNMKSYFDSKKMLFTELLKKGGKAVVVRSGHAHGGEKERKYDWGERLLKELQGDIFDRSLEVISCGRRAGCHITASRFHSDFQGVRAEVRTPRGNFSLTSPLVGEFNLQNLLAATGAGIALGIHPQVIKKALAKATGAPGRLERVHTGDSEIFVDYAHTPDALENVLISLRGLGPERLIVVFGCGGDRDAGKRPEMGRIAAQLADGVLLTSDNPRSESPDRILSQIERGVGALPVKRMRAEVFLRQGWHGCYDVIRSRREAIRVAVRYARKGDVVAICGKGHERYQIVKGKKVFFDDRLEAENSVNGAGGAP
ncbi:MAG: UDP-N-acetylmuramoyl-L-alanyl-D-glutamate--2,6-diaminopimelate ligase [Desulfobulbaceae bacterium]|nr:UDP-N-acetylmuramoyl-L-alanyl-D-glutamate--2,6-diaminopimelate ligase [Desulfobulbaceae bacterium]